MALIIAVIFISIAFPAVGADNTTQTTSATTIQTTTTTTVPTATQTTSATTVQTTATTTVPTTSTTTVQTTATTTVPTTSATTVQTTATTTVPTTTQTTSAASSQSSETAWFSAEPISGASPLTVQFTDTSTGYPTSWEWYFGDGSTGYVQNPSHTYTGEGTYSVALNVVIGGSSYTAIRNDVISVYETETTTTTTTQTTTSPTVSPIEAGFSASPLTGTAPLIVTFTDTSTGSPTTWDWDFGDDGSSTLQNPSHTYSAPGKYTVTLIATGSDGSDEVKRTTYIIVISPTPVITTKATAPVTSAGPTRASAMQAAALSKPAAEVASEGQNDLTIPWFYIIAIVFIAIIAGIGILIWRRRNRYDELG